ncbi:cation diffusion facilitator family transporter [Candidatus Zixiibacteriota bacterium]
MHQIVHDNKDGHTSAVEKTKAGYLVSALSAITNLVIAGFKAWAGLTTGSIAILADAWHSFSDTLSSVIVFISFRISAKPPDREHPYGHGRAELIATLVVGMLLAIVSFDFLAESIGRLSDRQAAEYSTLALVIIGISIVLKEVMTRISIRVGRRIGSPALIADGWHHRSDAISSVLILVGIIAGQRFWWTDGVLGLVITAVLLRITVSILKGAISPLLGERLDDELLEGIRAICAEQAGMETNFHNPRLHVYGEHRELTFHIGLPAMMRLQEAHKIADRLEGRIMEEMGIEATVHIDPIAEEKNGGNSSDAGGM